MTWLACKQAGCRWIDFHYQSRLRLPGWKTIAWLGYTPIWASLVIELRHTSEYHLSCFNIAEAVLELISLHFHQVGPNSTILGTSVQNQWTTRTTPSWQVCSSECSLLLSEPHTQSYWLRCAQYQLHGQLYRRRLRNVPRCQWHRRWLISIQKFID